MKALWIIALLATGTVVSACAPAGGAGERPGGTPSAPAQTSAPTPAASPTDPYGY